MRFLKQFFYGILLLIIFGGLAYSAYALFIQPAPTCSDGKQNGGETGIDCGGACNKECLPPDIKPVSVRGSIQVLPIGDATSTRGTVLVQIQNLNSDYGANFDYFLNVKDESGVVVISSIGENFIYSGEIKYLVFPNLSFLKEVDSLRAEFEIQKTEWVKEENMRKPSIFVQSENTTIFPDRIEIAGRFTNADAGTLSEAHVVAILYDNRGNAVGASQTRAERISSGETRVFVVNHPFVSSVNVSRTQVFVYPAR